MHSQHPHLGLSFDSRSRACPLTLPSSLILPRLHHLFEAMPHVTLSWSPLGQARFIVVAKAPEILYLRVPTWRLSHMLAAVCRFSRLHYQSGQLQKTISIGFEAVALFSVLECVFAYVLYACVFISSYFFPFLFFLLLFFLRVVTLILSIFLWETCQCVRPVACVLCLRALCCTPHTLLQTGPCK
jgi:hypothetical protein